MPAAYRARISALRSTFLGVFGGYGDWGVGEPKFSRFTSAETASSEVKIKLPSALKACGSRCPIGPTCQGIPTSGGGDCLRDGARVHRSTDTGWASQRLHAREVSEK